MEYRADEIALPAGRQRLTTLVRQAGDVIQVSEAAGILNLDRSSASKMLARWATQGWLRRVGHGAYVAVQLDSLASEQVLEDPWVLVPSLYAPCYIGGRTAAVHWDLTEQIFNDIVVLTARSIRGRAQRHHGAAFTLKHIKETKLFGTKTLWRGQTRVAISDVHKTIVDILDDPSIGGGIQHVADCLQAYLRGPDRHDEKLVEYADRLGNGAVFKRLGYLAEDDATAADLAHACRARLTKGNVKIDPSLDCPKLITRWRLWVPPFAIGSERQ